MSTSKAGLPYPEKRSSSLPVEERRSYFDVARRRRFWDATQTRRPPPHLLALVEALSADSVRDVLLVPTAVYWGRAPQKEGSWLRLLFAENWALTSRVRKFFSVLINGRNVMVEMGEPISLRSLLDASPVNDQARRVTRILRGILGASAPSASARISPTAARSLPRCCVPGRCAPWSRPMRATSTAISARACCRRASTRSRSPLTTRTRSCRSPRSCSGACGTACTTA